VKRTVIAAAILALGTAGAGVSLADPGNGHSGYGHCTAYFAGSDNGQAHKHQAGPFQQLESDAHDYEKAQNGGQDDPNTNVAQEVANYCANAEQNQKPGGGKG
jgi:hypothetical protein